MESIRAPDPFVADDGFNTLSQIGLVTQIVSYPVKVKIGGGAKNLDVRRKSYNSTCLFAGQAFFNWPSRLAAFVFLNPLKAIAHHGRLHVAGKRVDHTGTNAVQTTTNFI